MIADLFFFNPMRPTKPGKGAQNDGDSPSLSDIYAMGGTKEDLDLINSTSNEAPANVRHC